MKIDDVKINQTLTKYNELKGVDVHIDRYDSDSIKRQKDMMCGKLWGYEEALKQLGIIE